MSLDYQNGRKQVMLMSNEITDKRAKWLGNILFLCATLFGILISLHGETQTSLYTRLCFAVACISLALGILLLSIASYHHIAAQTRARNSYAEEVQNAHKENRAVEPVRADKIKFFLFCEVCAYICLLLSVLLLAVYSLLKAIL